MYRWEIECGFPLTRYSVLIFSCRSYILHHSVNVCRWELEGVLEKGEILQFYYGTNILLTHFFHSTQRLSSNIWTYRFLLINKKDKEGLKEMIHSLWSSYFSQRNNMRQEKMWMPYAEARLARVQIHREHRSATCPLWDDVTAEVHENQGPDGQYWLCKINQLLSGPLTDGLSESFRSVREGSDLYNRHACANPSL